MLSKQMGGLVKINTKLARALTARSSISGAIPSLMTSMRAGTSDWRMEELMLSSPATERISHSCVRADDISDGSPERRFVTSD